MKNVNIYILLKLEAILFVKTINWLLFVVMAACVLFACQNGQGSGNRGEIALLNSDVWWGVARNADLQRAVTEVMSKKAGFAVKATIIPLAQYKQHLVNLFSSENEPDLAHIMYASGFLPKYVEKKEILPLDDYIKNSDETSRLESSLLESIKINGHVYAMPCAQPAQKILWFRRDLVERFGIIIKDTMTTDEFHEQMKKALGNADVMPLSLPKFTDNFQFFFNAFGGYAAIYEKDGKHVDGFQSREIKESLLFIKSLYDEKIIERGLFRNENDTIRQSIATGKAIGVIDYDDFYGLYMQEAGKANAATDFIPMYALIGPGGAGATYNEGITDVWVISSDCKNPQSAFDLIKLLTLDAEGIIATRFGIEGKHFTVENGIAITTVLAKAGGADLSNGFLSRSLVPLRMPFRTRETKEEIIKRQFEISGKTKMYSGQFHMVPVWKSQRLADVNLAVKAKRDEAIIAIIMGTKTIESAYKSYEAYWKSIDGAGILAECDKYEPPK